jgi:hypothetical protein
MKMELEKIICHSSRFSETNLDEQWGSLCLSNSLFCPFLVSTPLKDINHIIANTWKNQKMIQTTNQIYFWEFIPPFFLVRSSHVDRLTRCRPHVPRVDRRHR